MAFVEIDNSFVRAIRCLHSASAESQNNIRAVLDEVIKSKYGPGKELGPYFNLSSTFQELPIAAGNTVNAMEISAKDDVKAAGDSDSELELDLKEILKEDLLCVVCKGMGVSARNRLVECLDCHNLYHQECHDPIVSNEETDASEWMCTTCKDVQANRTMKKTNQSPINVSSHKGSPSNLVPTIPKSYEKEYSDISSTKLHGSKLTSSSMSSSSLKSSSNRVMTPNINLVSADKRIQIMRKKAAKMQEKRKLSR